MRRGNALILSIVAAFSIATAAPSVAIAKESCTSWMDQGNGTSWKECVDDKGKQRCYEISHKPGSTAHEVSCK